MPCGVGEPFSEEISRAMVLLRANALMKGNSGVRPVLIERLVDLLNHGYIRSFRNKDHWGQVAT